MELTRKPRLSTLVASSLCSLMVERDLKPDDRLPAERELAAAFAVSRHVIREALGRLETLGLVSIDHGRGTIVRARPMPHDLSVFAEQLSESPTATREDGLEARAAFEAGLAELIIQRATETDLDRLESIVSAMWQGVKDGRAAGAEDVAFHEHLLRCTQNDLLIKTGQRLVLGYLQTSLIQAGGRALDAPETVDPAEHQDIVSAIRQRDADRLRLLLRFHGYGPDSQERSEVGLLAYWQRNGTVMRRPHGTSVEAKGGPT